MVGKWTITRALPWWPWVETQWLSCCRYDKMSAYELFKNCGVSKRCYEDFLKPTLLVSVTHTLMGPTLPLALQVSIRRLQRMCSVTTAASAQMACA